MKFRTVAKLGIILSVILFCIGIGLYGFAQLSATDKGQDVDVLSFVPQNSVGVLETDNLEFFMNEIPQTAYASQMDTLSRAGITDAIFSDLSRYAVRSAHGLSGQMNHVLISFHAPSTAQDIVVYFRVGKGGKEKVVDAICEKYGVNFTPKKETYRGEKIEIYPIGASNFVAVYEESGFLAVSYQNRLIEDVIDAKRDNLSLRNDSIFNAVYRDKSTNFMTLYGRVPSLPLLASVEDRQHYWSEFDIHLNSDVFYLSGGMYEPDSCIQKSVDLLHGINEIKEDSLLVLSGTDKIASYISGVIALPSHSLFDECVSNLSRDASFIMVADMDKVSRSPELYSVYLSPFILAHPNLFRSFILSVQITEVENRLSHIFVFTYKD